MKIGDREIGNGQPTYIIAEAGTNHMGQMMRAQELVVEAAEAGADAIKFQAFKNNPFEPLFCPYEGDEQRIEYWNDTCLTYKEWGEVAALSYQNDIHFILSIFQEAALPFLDHCDAAKVASRAAKTYPYDKVDLPLIISDGMSSPLDIMAAVDFRKNVTVLKCVAKYPTPLDDAMDMASEIPEVLGVPYFGVSDHSGKPWPGLRAISNFSSILEVHFSSEKTGRDAVVELTVDELKLLCDFRDAVAL